MVMNSSNEHEKQSSQCVVKLTTTSSCDCFLPNWVDIKIAVCYVIRQLEIYAINVKQTVQNDSFSSCLSVLISRLINHAARLAFSPHLNKPLMPLDNIAGWLALVYTLLRQT